MASNDAPLELLEPGKLILCQTDVDARPISWIEEDGSRRGFEPALAELIGEALGLEVVWLDVTRWEDFPAALLERRCDAILCNQAITPARRVRYAFTNPYGVFAEAVLSRRGAGIRGDADLAGKVVAAIPNSTNLAYANAIPGTRRVVQYDTGLDFVSRMVGAVVAGDVDGFVEDEIFLLQVVAADDAVEVAYVTDSTNEYGIALRHGDDNLRRALDSVIENLLATGKLEALWNEWFEGVAFAVAPATGLHA